VVKTRKYFFMKHIDRFSHLCRRNCVPVLCVFLISFLVSFSSLASATTLIIFTGQHLSNLDNLIVFPNGKTITSMEIQTSCWVPGLNHEDIFIYNNNQRSCKLYEAYSASILPDRSYFADLFDNSTFIIYDTDLGTVVPENFPQCIDQDLDSDADTIPDCLDFCPESPLNMDDDNDGIPNCVDGCPDDENKTGPGSCGCNVVDIDIDGDLIPDCVDHCPEDPDKTAPGKCGCGVSDVDSDNDGTPDCNDNCPADTSKTTPGVCGCGVSDADGDNDGTPDCNDNCPADASKTTPGVCGCGIPDEDLNSNGIMDCKESNSTLFPLKNRDGKVFILTF